MSRPFLLVLFVCLGCTYFKTQPVTEPEEKSAWQTAFDSTAFFNYNLSATALTKAFYRDNNYQLVWNDTALNDAGDSMVSIIREAQQYGLNASDYHLEAINKLLLTPSSHSRAVSLDLYLTDGFFVMYHHLKNGRVKKNLSINDIREVTDADVHLILQNALEENTVRQALESQEPAHQQYLLLKEELRKMLSASSLDVISRKRINQLVVNMERWRWQQKSLPPRYIAVNSPSYQLRVVDQDSVWLRSKVIVGKTETQTPELESVIRSFIIYPYWHVPRSIVKEILPNIQRDSLYLIKHNYQVLDKDGIVLDHTLLDWQSFSPENFPYVLRQREGSENTMGVIKFVFSNNYGVYLHDTNARGLFSREKRALSHGCVRVHKAVALAHYLAKDDDTFVGPEDLDQYLLVQHKMKVDVVKPIPVLLQYFTAFAEDGKVFFYDDIYGKDQELLNALYHVSLHTAEEIAPPLL